MVYVIYNADGTIKTFMQDVTDIRLQTGESYVGLDLDMDGYARRFMLSCNDVCCYTVTAHVGDPAVQVNVYAPGYDSVVVDINGESCEVSLESGRGTIEITTDAAGQFLLSPVDKKLFCAAGSGSLCVEILE